LEREDIRIQDLTLNDGLERTWKRIRRSGIIHPAIPLPTQTKHTIPFLKSVIRVNFLIIIQFLEMLLGHREIPQGERIEGFLSVSEDGPVDDAFYGSDFVVGG
jgi:hypothetical protein